MINNAPTRRSPAAVLAVVSGLAITVLGLGTIVDADFLGSAWFVAAGVAVLLVVPGLLRLRQAASGLPTARGALAISVVFMTVFGLSHFYALVDQDRAVVLFTVFMLMAAISLAVAGAVIIRRSSRRSGATWLPLLCGVWPVVTVPLGAALGDVPHFLAIAGWGVLWAAFGVALLRNAILAPVSAAEQTTGTQLQPS